MRVRALAVAGLSALLLTACGGSSDDAADGSSSAASSSEAAEQQSGPELVEAAATALEQADSVHLQGSMSLAQGPSELDLRLRGADVAGSMTIQGQQVQVMAVAGAFYMQAPVEMWTSQGVPAVIATRLADSWVLVPSEGGGLSDLSVESLVAEMRSPSDATVEEEVTATELDDDQRVAFFRDVLGPVARRIPLGVLFVRVVDGVDLGDPVGAARGRPVFELRSLG